MTKEHIRRMKHKDILHINQRLKLAMRLLFILCALSLIPSDKSSFTHVLGSVLPTIVSDEGAFSAYPDEYQSGASGYKKMNGAQESPNDPLFADQWYLKMHTVDNAFGTQWQFLYEYLQSIQTENPNRLSPVMIAVLDTGVNTNHIDMNSQAIFVNPGEISGDHVDNDHNGYIDDTNGCSFIQGVVNCANLNDDSSVQHGTAVVGTINAVTNNTEGIAGNVGIPISILPVKVIMPDGIANYSDIKMGLQYILDMIDQGYPIKVVNMSFAGFPNQNPSADILIQQLLDKGVVLVAGSGNSSDQYPGVLGWPARHEGVIAVGGTDNTGKRHPHSNYGMGLDVVAPYGPINTLCYQNEYCILSGTSLSAPQVTLLTAALLSLDKNLSVLDISNIITRTATKTSVCTNQECGDGIVDYMNAVLRHKVYMPLVSR